MAPRQPGIVWGAPPMAVWPVAAARSPFYLPKNARWSCRDCEDESRDFESASTASSATFRCSGGRDGTSRPQLRRARTFASILALSRVTSSASRCNARTCSSSVSNPSSSIAKSREHYSLPNGLRAHLRIEDLGALRHTDPADDQARFVRDNPHFAKRTMGLEPTTPGLGSQCSTN
jgi:hypothetical protein